MLIVKLEPEKNGARANQRLSEALNPVPEGWAAVPAELEDGAAGLLPWLTLTLENGAITAVGEDAAAKQAFEEKQKQKQKQEQEENNELNG